MQLTEAGRQTFVESLARRNRAVYGTPDGRRGLRPLELIFEHNWIYVFELVQNALDAGARSIALRCSADGDRLTFQHDGHRAVRESEVEGLSKPFQSTKGAATVGFMGVGFKSVFGRFREARISGWGWTFRYKVDVVVGGRYGDVQTDLLGAVMPIWDDRIPQPDSGFTTRFDLSSRLDEDADLGSDLACLVHDDDLTLLAILAASKLKRLDVDGRGWDLDVDDLGHDGSYTASARSGEEVSQWRLFPVEFEPSRPAIARFLKHRHIRPDELPEEEREQVYAAAARPRCVLGVLPLDARGAPDPPPRGRVYATLPTDVMLPFGLHINADWLLNISRTGLREIGDNPWQRDIADRIADVLASFLRWVARTCSEPEAASAAFAALAAPSQQVGSLEAILAEPRWLSRLRDQLEDSKVVPVWTEGGALSFAVPHEVIVPPPALAAAFERQPALRPAALLKGPVLVRHVLGSGGRELMVSTGLLTEISQHELEQLWADGLEEWWEGIEGEEPARRDLLFHLWAAVSRLTAETAWSATNLPCVRTANRTWQSVGESAFFRGRLPSDHDTGGVETRQFIQPFIDMTDYVAEAWIQVLSRGAGTERQRGKQEYLSQAWQWIETHARGIGLSELVESAVHALEVSQTPDWSVLLPLGRWALRGSRPDVLIRVLAASEVGPCAVPVNTALLSNPYVRNQNLEILFPGTPVISAAYLEDPETADPYEWRAFFEKAGAKGPLRVRAVDGHEFQGHTGTVVEFLGTEVGSIGWSNAAGYTLRDFDIEPALPGPNAPEELRKALSAWLDDGFNALHGKGRRQGEYVYRDKYKLSGVRPSAWLVKLSALAWVPNHGKLRLPEDVLPRPDAAREGAPVAELSAELVSVLEQEGMSFGTAIPEATALQRFLSLGSQPTADELAASLREVREQVLTDEDRRLFEQAVLRLRFPSTDDRRVPLDQIVRSVGGGRLRGALGDRIVPLTRFHEQLIEELQHDSFPYAIPETTTGDQALDCLRDVWHRARSAPAGLANDVRDVLPLAYAYCLDDCADDPSLRSRWEAAEPEAAAFVDRREWVLLADAENVYFDDVDDRRFIPETIELRTVTAGHFGNSPAEQRRAAEALRLPLLSSAVQMEWSGQVGEPVARDWVPRFDLVCELLRTARRSERADSEVGENPGMELRHSRDLVLKVSSAGGSAECVPVNARLQDNVLTVSGRPIQFGSDAAKELLRYLGFRQRGELAADLTGMLTAIADDEDFQLAADKFRRSFAPGFVQTPPVQPGSPNREDEKTTEPEDDPSQTPGAVEHAAENRPVTEPSTPQPPSEDAGRRSVDPPPGKASTETQSDTPADDDSVEPQSSSSSYTRDRALARQKAIAKTLRSALKGEITPAADDEEVEEPENEGGPRGDGSLGDEVYREIAARYERASGRNPEIGNPSQTGWDLRSIDPKTGTKRLIEVKGKGCPWVQDEVVELSRAQVHKAFETLDGRTPDGSWYLYVVERTEDGRFQVLPIENPVRVAGTWILSGESWREIATEPRLISMPTEDDGQQR